MPKKAFAKIALPRLSLTLAVAVLASNVAAKTAPTEIRRYPRMNMPELRRIFVHFQCV